VQDDVDEVMPSQVVDVLALQGCAVSETSESTSDCMMLDSANYAHALSNHSYNLFIS